MIIIRRSVLFALVATASITLSGCDDVAMDASTQEGHKDDEGHGHAHEDGGAASDHVSIPKAVRSNLGISFVRVERRRIEQTLRVPGRFEYLPTARREYRTAVPGRVELLVEQFDRVGEGQALYRLDSPGWRDTQQQLADATSQIERYGARLGTFEPLLEAHQAHEDSLHESVAVWNDRVKQLQTIREAGGGGGGRTGAGPRCGSGRIACPEEVLGELARRARHPDRGRCRSAPATTRTRRR